MYLGYAFALFNEFCDYLSKKKEFEVFNSSASNFSPFIDWKNSHVYYLDDWLIIILVIYYIYSLEFSPQTNVHNDAEIPEISDKTESESVSAEDRTGRWARVTFKIVLSYHGGSFDGWQKQPGLNTVQRLVVFLSTYAVWLKCYSSTD